MLQPPVTAPQDFLPFLDRFILGLEQDYPPDHLGDNPANGPYSYFGNGAAPLGRRPLQRLARATLARRIFSSSFLSRSTQVSSSSNNHPGTSWLKRLKALGRHQFFQLPKPRLSNKALPMAPSRLRSSTS